MLTLLYMMHYLRCHFDLEAFVQCIGQTKAPHDPFILIDLHQEKGVQGFSPAGVQGASPCFPPFPKRSVEDALESTIIGLKAIYMQHFVAQ